VSETTWQILASPAERLQLVLVLFQLDEEGKPRLQIKHGLEGRVLRTFMRELDLRPIREAVAQWNAVNAKLAHCEDLERFTVSRESCNFFRERVADLPRTAAQECVVGDLFDSLHLVAPANYGRDAQEVEFFIDHAEALIEDWNPPKVREVPLNVQAAIDELEDALEQLPEETRKPVIGPLEVFVEKVRRLLDG
jgi:hypothetical protein